VLRDAGREAEAKTAMTERNAPAKVERSVAKSMEQMREERQAQSGRRVCP
jgi:hypothetical protein